MIILFGLVCLCIWKTGFIFRLKKEFYVVGILNRYTEEL